MLYCPDRLPFNASSLLPGGMRRSSSVSARLSIASLRIATVSMPTKRLTRCPSNRCCVYEHLYEDIDTEEQYRVALVLSTANIRKIQSQNPGNSHPRYQSNQQRSKFLSSISKAKKRETYHEFAESPKKSAANGPAPIPIRKNSIQMKLLKFQEI